MRYFLIVALFAAAPVFADEQRAFSIDGSVYQLMPDGTYTELTQDHTDNGRISLYISAAQDVSKGCQLRMALSNNTERTIRDFGKVFNAFTRQRYEGIGFYFGGPLPSDAINPGEIVYDEYIFESGKCNEITEIEIHTSIWPYQEAYHVDGLSSSDSAKLIHYPDIGLFPILLPQD